MKSTTDRFYLLRIRRQSTAALLAKVSLCALAAHAQKGLFLYMPNNVRSGVSVVDTEVGSSRYDLAITPDGKTLYAADTFGNSVTVINTANNEVRNSIDLGVQPFGLAVNPNGKTRCDYRQQHSYVQLNERLGFE